MLCLLAVIGFILCLVSWNYFHVLQVDIIDGAWVVFVTVELSVKLSLLIGLISALFPLIFLLCWRLVD